MNQFTCAIIGRVILGVVNINPDKGSCVIKDLITGISDIANNLVDAIFH